MAGGGLELHGIEAEGAVAGDQDHLLLGAGQPGGHGEGQAYTQAAELQPVGDDTRRLAGAQGDEAEVNGVSPVNDVDGRPTAA